MAPRQRKTSNRSLPAGMRERGGYYSWRHPVTGEEYGLGRNRKPAMKEAIKANAHLADKTPELIERIATGGRSWGDWLDRYTDILAKRDIAENTRRTYKSLMKLARTMIPDAKAVQDIDTADVSDALDSLVTAGKNRLAQSFRSFLTDCFRVSIAKGWRKDNPVHVTDRVAVTVMRARLQFDVFMRVYNAEKTPWAKNAYALALVGAQRREDIAEAQFKRDIREGAWWVDQGKTGSRVIIPLSLRLDVFGMTLGEVVSQCRSTGVLSPYLIHQTRPYGNSAVGSQIWIDTISRHFGGAVAALGIDWAGKQPPTFHEIRSLSERLYKAQGNVNTQELLGHKHASTTAIYHDARGEWVRVSVKPESGYNTRTV